MASITIKVTAACASGDHVVISATGDVTHTVKTHVDDVLGAMDDDEKDIIIRGLLRLIKLGKTKAQFKSSLQTGVTIVL